MRSKLSFQFISIPFRQINTFPGKVKNGSSFNASLRKKVVFNWDNIKNLRGFEKIDLFRDYARTVDSENALKVYMIMKENDLLPRLTYVDHHKMFHLLLKDKAIYRKEICDVWNWLKENRYYPSEGLYKEMFLCFKHWNDLHGATALYGEMLSSKVKIDLEIHKIMLMLYTMSKDTRNHLEGIKLWNTIGADRFKPAIAPFALELFGKIKDVNSATDLFEAMQPAMKKGEFHYLKHQSIYLAALIHAEAYDKAIEFYEKNFRINSWTTASTHPTQIYKSVYNTMMKLCYRTLDLSLADQILEDVENDGLITNDQMNSRYLVILGVKKGIPEAEEFYNQKVLEVDSKRRLFTFKLGLLEVYCIRLERQKAEKIAAEIDMQPFKLFSMNFLEKMYHGLCDSEAAERMAKLIENYKEWDKSTPDVIENN